MVGKCRCATYQGCTVRQIWSLPAWGAEPVDSRRSFHHGAALRGPLWKSFQQDPEESSSAEPPPLTPDMPASPNTRAQYLRIMALKMLHWTRFKTLKCIFSLSSVSKCKSGKTLQFLSHLLMLMILHCITDFLYQPNQSHPRQKNLLSY